MQREAKKQGQTEIWKDRDGGTRGDRDRQKVAETEAQTQAGTGETHRPKCRVGDRNTDPQTETETSRETGLRPRLTLGTVLVACRGASRGSGDFGVLRGVVLRGGEVGVAWVGSGLDGACRTTLDYCRGGAARAQGRGGGGEGASLPQSAHPSSFFMTSSEKGDQWEGDTSPDP